MASITVSDRPSAIAHKKSEERRLSHWWDVFRGVFCMRNTIETAPRNGNVVILKDEARGTYDVAHWSPESGEWIGEDGETTKITPSHWYPLPADKYLEQGLSSPSQAATPARRYNFF